MKNLNYNFVDDLKESIYNKNLNIINTKYITQQHLKEKIGKSSVLSYCFNNESIEHFKFIIDLIDDVDSNDSIWKDMFTYSFQENSKEYFDILIKSNKYDFNNLNYENSNTIMNFITKYDSLDKYKNQFDEKFISLFCLKNCLINESKYNESFFYYYANKAIDKYLEDVIDNNILTLTLSDGVIIKPILVKLSNIKDLKIENISFIDYIKTIINRIEFSFGLTDVLEKQEYKSYYHNFLSEIENRK